MKPMRSLLFIPADDERKLGKGVGCGADADVLGCLRAKPAGELLSRAVDSLPLSARGRARVARVAATIAALAGVGAVGAEHVAEALSYRSPTELGSWT